MKTAGEKAMALVDGQLAPAEVPELVQELARNATLVAELQDYLATSHCRIGAAFAAKADEPVPRRLVDAVLKTPLAVEPLRPAAPASSLAGRLAAWLRGSCRVPAWSLAAAPTLAAAAAFALAAVVLPAVQGSPGGRGDGRGDLGHLASSELSAALERAAAGKETAFASVRPILSFASKDGGWCRQFEVKGAGKQTSHGLACRAPGGGWRLVALTAPYVGGKFAPAGADRRKMIDDIVTSMIVGEPLTPEGEADAIGKGWQL